MDCQKASILMMEYIDGIINETDKIVLLSHLDQCERCKEEFSMLSETLDLVDDMEEIDPPEEIETLVMSQVKLNKYEKKSKLWVYLRRVSLALLIFGGVLTYIAFNHPNIYKQMLVSGVIDFVNFMVIKLPNIINLIQENFVLIFSVGISILMVLLSSIIILVIAEFYIIEKLNFSLRR